MSPSEFRKLTPSEWWRIYEAKKPRDPKNDYAGSLTQKDVDELQEMLKQCQK